MKIRWAGVCILVLMAACGGGLPVQPTQPLLTQPAIALPAQPEATSTLQAWTPTPSLTPALTFTPTAIPSPMPVLVQVQALVWPADPQVPILVYHQFMPDSGDASHALKIRLSDFRAQLQALYDSGYSLVSLSDWLAGKIVAPVGRRPLILSMDDLFYNNQLTLTEGGEPSPETGIGVLWQFSQEHPDFSFHAALFASLGEKLYANPDDPGWQDDLGNAIAWCLDHDAQVYNHFYTHPRLDLTDAEGVTWEARMNDRYLRDLLKRVHREDLVPRLENLIALPFGEWPAMASAKKALLDYVSPEGKSLQGVLEIDYIVRPKFLLPYYSPDFDPMHIPRIVSTQSAIDYLVQHSESFPAMGSCDLGLMEKSQAEQVSVLETRLTQAIQDGKCSYGIYIIGGKILNVGISGASFLPSPGGE